MNQTQITPVRNETMGDKAQVPADSYEREIGPFGGCPECGGDDGYMNVGPIHWLVCDRHKTKWFVGANLFSCWRDESEEKHKRNAVLLQGYREVAPILEADEPAASGAFRRTHRKCQSPELNGE